MFCDTLVVNIFYILCSLDMYEIACIGNIEYCRPNYCSCFVWAILCFVDVGPRYNFRQREN